MAPTFCDSPI
jgi:hypothetical protein